MKLTITTGFLDDRSERDLPCGTVLKEGRYLADIEATPEVAADLIDDAAYQGWFTDANPRRTTARSTFRKLIEQGIAYRHGVKRDAGGFAYPADR